MVIYKAAKVLCTVYSNFLTVILEIPCAHCSIKSYCQRHETRRCRKRRSGSKDFDTCAWETVL